MSDPVASQPAAPAPPTPANGTAAAAPSREDFLAGLAKAKAAAPAPEAPVLSGVSTAKAEGASAAAVTVDDADPDADLDDAEIDEPSDPDADLAEPDEEPEVAAKADPELARRISLVNRHEAAKRQTLERDRATFDREKAAWQEQHKPLLEQVERAKTIGTRLRTNLIATLAEHGIGPEYHEVLARELFAETAQGKADPKNAAYARELRAKQEVLGTAAEAEKRVKALEDQLAARDVQSAMQHKIETVFSAVPSLASDKTPHARHVLTSNAARAKQDMAQISYEMLTSGADIPTPKALLVAYEKRLRQDYRDRYGVEAEKTRRDALGTTPAAPANANTAAVKAKPAVAKPAAKVAAKAAEPEAPGAEPDDLPPINVRALDPVRERILAGIAREKNKAGGN